MNKLASSRENLKASLTAADLHAFTTIPEKVTPPFVAVAPDDPYISYESGAGLNFGEVFVRHRLVLVVAAGVNDIQANALDDLILAVLAVDLDPHEVIAVDEPGSIVINGQKHLGTSISLSTPINLLEDV